MDHISLVIEIVSMVVCLYNIFRKKIFMDGMAAILILLLITIQEYMNYLRLNTAGTFLVYIVLFLYSQMRFKEPLLRTGARILLHLMIMVVIQFIALILVNFILPGDERVSVRTFTAGNIILLVNIVVQHKRDFELLWLPFLKKNITMLLTGGFILSAAFIALTTSKKEAGFLRENYVIVIGLILVAVSWMGKWVSAQRALMEKERAIELAKQEEDHFQELLTDVRLRQHGFKNHLAAIFAAQYTHKTYDQLVQAQNEYWGEYRKENRYNSLLLIESRLLAGFLYRKLQEMEAKGISVECEVQSRLEHLSVPAYHMVEILGIFMDNAAEEVLNSESVKRFYLGIREERDGYCFSMRNPCKWISYEEIAGWFTRGVSTKGKDRGLGLYSAKKLCEYWKCTIYYENISLSEENWIRFCLEVKKKKAAE